MLYALAAVLAVQIPTSIQAIPDAKVRAGFQVVVLLMVILFAGRAKPPSPPAIPTALVPEEPITLPDPPTRRFSLYVA